MASALLFSLQTAGPDCGIRIENTSAVTAFLTAAAHASVSSRLVLILDYDLTMSASTTSECHHMLRDAAALPVAFREEVRTLFAATDKGHPEHKAIFGQPDHADRPHRFWMHYNLLLIRHGITVRMIEDAVAEEKAARGALLRPGVGELLSLCDARGVTVVVLSAGIDAVIRAACAQDSVELPASCHLLTNHLLFNEAGCCIAVEPSPTPASREGKLLLLTSQDTLADKDLVLMVGDKPVDALVARGLPPLRHDGTGGLFHRQTLSFGFYNTAGESSMATSSLQDYRETFDILAEFGDACSFAPLVAMLSCLLEQETVSSDSVTRAIQAESHMQHQPQPIHERLLDELMAHMQTRVGELRHALNANASVQVTIAGEDGKPRLITEQNRT